MLVSAAPLIRALDRAQAEDAGFFAEVVDGAFRIIGQGWDVRIAMRSWAPTRVYGAYYTPLSGQWQPRIEYLSVEIDDEAGGGLYIGARYCVARRSGRYWVG